MMSARTLRAWMAVHSWRPGTAVVLTAMLISLASANRVLSEIGPIRLMLPISPLLLLPALAAMGVGLACHSAVRMGLPDPSREKCSRFIWLTGWTVIAWAAVSSGQLLASAGAGPAIARNLLIFTALGVLAMVLGGPSATAVPVLVYLMMAMLFPHVSDGSRYGWWAAILTPSVTSDHMLVAGGAWAVAALAYICRLAR